MFPSISQLQGIQSEAGSGNNARYWISPTNKTMQYRTNREMYDKIIYCIGISSTIAPVFAAILIRDIKQNPENRISVLETKSGSTSSANEIEIFFTFVKKIT